MHKNAEHYYYRFFDRYQEAQQLKAELIVAKLAEKAARDKYQDFMRTSSLYGVCD
jgi:hypothetical protein